MADGVPDNSVTRWKSRSLANTITTTMNNYCFEYILSSSYILSFSFNLAFRNKILKMKLNNCVEFKIFNVRKEFMQSLSNRHKSRIFHTWLDFGQPPKSFVSNTVTCWPNLYKMQGFHGEITRVKKMIFDAAIKPKSFALYPSRSGIKLYLKFTVCVPETWATHRPNCREPIKSGKVNSLSTV